MTNTMTNTDTYKEYIWPVNQLNAGYRYTNTERYINDKQMTNTDTNTDTQIQIDILITNTNTETNKKIHKYRKIY